MTVIIFLFPGHSSNSARLILKWAADLSLTNGNNQWGQGMQKITGGIIPEAIDRKFYMQHLAPYDFIKPLIKGKRVLEIGCGDGYGAAYLAQTADQVIGVDFGEEVPAAARLKYPAANLTFEHMDALALGFGDNAFDAVCSFQVIEHIPEEQLTRYLSEIRRVLKAGGAAYISTLNLDHAMKSPLTYQKQAAHRKEFRYAELSDLLGGVFPGTRMYGLHSTLKQLFFHRLKRIGIFNFLPEKINPVKIFYQNMTTRDFQITAGRIRQASDFICVCFKNA
ncbi:MAG: methyltransferase domain-containing protein [Candidatus Omnitrophica bacterium]|nr:methyltransferase domain-containing protein [Candidatus Omnitrophota bacterium]